MRKTKIAFDDFSLSLKSLDAKFRSKYNTCGSRFCYFDNSHFLSRYKDANFTFLF